ncbi:energy transducer TonB [Acetobacter persici]|uniref:energy transducer TonB n=1 Tax=Acetobacter persici TaxID=1076596 RepID=UPI0039EAB9E7
MKDHAQQQQSPVRFVVGTGAVVGVVALLVVILLHLLAVMGLMFGMGTSASVPVSHPPIKTRILPPPPKPPIKHVARTPPKKAPPPQTTTAPAPPVSSEPASTAAPTNSPDTSAGTSPLNNARPVYPPDMEEDNIEGRVTVACDVETTGMTSNCSVQSVQGGQSFAQAALDYVHKARYRPAMKNGVPVKELHKVYVIRFRLDD